LSSTFPNEPKWYVLAISHQCSAIRLARPYIANTISTSSEPLFIFSGYNSLFSFTEPTLRPNGGDTAVSRDYLGELIDSFRMARGVRAVIANNSGVLLEKGLINNAAWTYDKSGVVANLDRRFPQMHVLQNLVACNIEDEGQRAATHKVVRALFVYMGVLDDTPSDHSSASMIHRWAIAIAKEFLEMCDARHPVALVVLTFYAVLMNKRANLWFFRRWPRLILQSTRKELAGTDFEQCIEWSSLEVEQHVDSPANTTYIESLPDSTSN
jgi:hypothetical protein